MRARDIMTSPVHTVRPSTTVGEAAAILTRHDITALPVLDDDDRLVGMVSEGDLLWHRVPASPDAHLWRRPDDGLEDPPGTVGEVMTTPAVALSAGADAAGIAETMLTCDLRSIPIVEGATVVGIVSRRDVLRTLVRPDEALAAEVRDRLERYTGAAHHWDVRVDDRVATVTGIPEGADARAVRALVASVPGVLGVHLSTDRTLTDQALTNQTLTDQIPAEPAAAFRPTVAAGTAPPRPRAPLRRVDTPTPEQ